MLSYRVARLRGSNFSFMNQVVDYVYGEQKNVGWEFGSFQFIIAFFSWKMFNQGVIDPFKLLSLYPLTETDTAKNSITVHSNPAVIQNMLYPNKLSDTGSIISQN